jgi:oligopeptide/dipeptide ABC transporter ATP-binding protein
MAERAHAPLMSLEGVSRSFTTGSLFGRVRVNRAVEDVSLDIGRGEVVGIVGESGCGKSTVARLMLRLLPPTQGRVLFDGEDLARLSDEDLRRRRRRMQMVFQDPTSSLDPRYTVRETLVEPFTIQGLGPSSGSLEAAVDDLLDKVGLARSLRDRRPHELSGGQKQRVGIARALALDPDFVVLDEPTASLDVSIQAQVIALLQDIKSRLGLTYAFISHDLGLVRYFCTRVVVMYLGRIVEILPDPGSSPRHPYTRALVESTFVPDPTRRRVVARLSGEVPSGFAVPSGCAFAGRCPAATGRCSTERPEPSTTGGHLTACHHPLD